LEARGDPARLFPVKVTMSVEGGPSLIDREAGEPAPPKPEAGR